MAREGKRVLLADVDPKGSLTTSLGYHHPDQLDSTLADVMGFIIADRPVLTINALAAADEVIIPMQAHYFSIKGLEQLLRTISKMKLKINPRLDIAGILITMADMRTNYSCEIVDLLRNAYGNGVRITYSLV